MKVEQAESYEPIVITLATPNEAKAFCTMIDFYVMNNAPKDVTNMAINLSNAFGSINIPE